MIKYQNKKVVIFLPAVLKNQITLFLINGMESAIQITVDHNKENFVELKDYERR